MLSFDLGRLPVVCDPGERACAIHALLRAVGDHAGVTLQAAILHDTLEDTQTTPAELGAVFGPKVRRLVEEVTDDKRLPKAERKLRSNDA